MESYIVSALKYRPQTFQSVVGQNALTATLKNAIVNKKLAHAYLFCGPRGVGKTTCARIFAKTINCESLTKEHEACNVCESCKTFNEQRSLSIHELDAASNNSVDDIRVLTEQVRIPPQLGKYSVYIIDEVHMLSQGAFNAFLKTLEEPPAHAIFILATTEKHKIIPTILSRCQIYDFNRISVTDTANHIRFVAKQEGVSIDENALNVIAQKSDGGMRDALSIFDQLVSFSGANITYQSTIENLNVLDYEYYFRLVNKALEGSVSESLLIFNEVLNKGFDAHHFITGLSSHLRDILVSKDPITIQLLEVGADIGERYKKQAAIAPVDFLFNALNISNECDLNYRISKNKRLLVELTLIKICQLVGDKKKILTGHETTTLQKVEPTQQASEVKPNQPTNSVSTEKPVVSAPSTASETSAQQPVQTNTTTPASATEIKADSAPKHPAEHTIPNIPRTISISNFRSEEAQSTTVSEPKAAFQATNEFSTEELIEKWKDFSQKEEIDPGTKAFLETHLPSKIDEQTIEIFVDNRFQEKELNQMDIISYLRKELENSNIRLKIELIPETEQKRAQTPQDIYKRMVKDFPMLEKLRKNLDMEID